MRRSTLRAVPALLLLAVATLNVIGLVMVLSASSVTSLRNHGSTWTYFNRQALWVAIGAAALLVTSRIDHRRWRRLARPLLLGTMVLLVLVLVPGLGIEVDGGQRWLGAGPLTIQPAEVAKLAVLVFAADLLARRARHVGSSRRTLQPILIMVAVVALLVMLQPDLGTTIVIGVIAVSVLAVAGVPALQLGGVAALATGGTLALALRAPYRRRRLLAFLDPAADPTGAAYQINQSLMGVASGGLLGVGLGASRAKWGFLPNAHTDFIFAIIGEELGLLGALLVIGLFLLVAVLGTVTALHAPDRFGMLLAAGITTWVLVQAFINIGGTVGVLPITGLPLPYLSFGGSALVTTMAATGILVNVARLARPLDGTPGGPPQSPSTARAARK